MYNLANEFEEHFKRRLSEVKEFVAEPTQPRVHLKLGSAAPVKSGLKLKFGKGSSPTPTSTSARNTPGVTIDNEARERQKALVNAGVSGQIAPSEPPASRSTSHPGSVLQFNDMPNKGPAPSPPELVKMESQPSQFSSLQTTTLPNQEARTAKSMAMPPPLSRPLSSSPHTHLMPPHHATPAYVQAQSTPQFRLRSPGFPPLLAALHVRASDRLNPSKDWSIALKPSITKTHTSATLNLPPTHYSLTLVPKISPHMDDNSYRVWVVNNGNKMLQAPAHNPIVGNLASELGLEKPMVYDITLQLGIVNRVAVEVVHDVSNLGRGERNKGELEVERCDLYVNLLRA